MTKEEVLSVLTDLEKCISLLDQVYHITRGNPSICWADDMLQEPLRAAHKALLGCHHWLYIDTVSIREEGSND